MKTKFCFRWFIKLSVLVTTSFTLLLPETARALNDLTQYKLFGHWTNPTPSTYYFGYVMAANEKWVIVGSPYASEPAMYVGTVQIYTAANGTWTRRLISPSLTSFSNFGACVALNGDVLAVGAPGVDSSLGAVYIYNVQTGALLRTLTVTGAPAGERLGTSVAITGQRVVTGASSYNANRGAVYVFNLSTGAPLGRMDLGASGAVNDSFGASLAVEGNLVFIGASGLSGAKGGGFLFNLETLQQVGASFQPGGLVAGDFAGNSVAMSRGRVFLGAYGRNSNKGAVFCTRKYEPFGFIEISASDGVAGDTFGYSISADAGMLLVGAQGASSYTGAAYLFDVGAFGTGAVEVRKIQPRDAQPSMYFGVGVALAGNTAVIGAYTDGTQGTYAGAAYLLRPLIVPFSPLAKVAAKGEFATGVPDATFNVLGDGFINGYNNVAFSSTLAGLGSNGGTDTGVWSNMVSPPGILQLVRKSRQAQPGGEVIQSVAPPILNEQGHVLLPVTMKVGTGATPVTAATSKWLLDQGTSGAPTFLTSTGTTTGVASFSAAKVQSFIETVQGDRDFQNYWGTTVKLTPGAALGTTGANDSGVLSHSGLAVEGYREGADTVPGSGTFYGQFTGRLSLLIDKAVFSAATTGPTTTNQVVVIKTVLSGTPAVVMQKGDTAPESAGSPVLSALLGESSNGADTAVVRATLKPGPGITAANNEGLWSRDSTNVKHEVLRKGGTVTGTTLTVAKIINVWSTWWFFGGGTMRAIVLAQLKGAGVNATNDQALLLVQEGSTAAAPNLFLLMREGDAAPGCSSGRIGTINRVIADGYEGSYLVLVTLAGAPAGTELAVYAGRTSSGNATTDSILRRPSLFLRKGWLFDGQPGKIKSISLPAHTVTASGFGGTGRGTCIGWSSYIIMTVEFDNGVRQIMKGRVP